MKRNAIVYYFCDVLQPPFYHSRMYHHHHRHHYHHHHPDVPQHQHQQPLLHGRHPTSLHEAFPAGAPRLFPPPPSSSPVAGAGPGVSSLHSAVMPPAPPLHPPAPQSLLAGLSAARHPVTFEQQLKALYQRCAQLVGLSSCFSNFFILNVLSFYFPLFSVLCVCIQCLFYVFICLFVSLIIWRINFTLLQMEFKVAITCNYFAIQTSTSLALVAC